MSFWDRLLGKKSANDPAANESPPSSGAPTSIRAHGNAHDKRPFARLALVGEADGPEEAEALAMFRAARSSPEEASAVDVLVRRSRIKKLPEALAVSLASALSDRGENGTAIEVLAQETSPSALLLAADLHADRGQVPAALALTERVLARDLDHPGARERHRRWREALGLTREAARANPWDRDANTMVAREPDAPFVLLRELARGGAGAVYEAEDRELGRRVALKVYHQPERDRAQLTHEARVAAVLAGPHVVKVFDADPEHGWIALEWAPMGAVKDAIRGGVHRGSLLPIDAWAIPLASALAAAHASGWVHLDVKPANVLLKERGALLADFGIARRAGEASPPGSLGYVSPERIAGAPAAFADDVFGFGRLLEDVLDAVAGDTNHAAHATQWRAFASACTGPLATRPANAGALLTRLKVELA